MRTSEPNRQAYCPPCSEDAELSVIGSIMLDDTHLDAVAQRLTPGDFRLPRCAAVFREMLLMRADGVPIDTAILAARLENHRDDVSLADLVEMADAVPTAANAAWYADTVAKLAERRRAWMLADRLKALAHQGHRGDQEYEAWRAEIEAVPSTVFRSDVGSGGITYRRFTSSELDAGDFTTATIIDGALFDQLQLVLGGPSKSLKSSLAVDAAIAIDTGGHWLGYFPVTAAKHVSVFSGESGMGVLQDLARRVCSAAGKRLSDTNIDWSPDLPILGAIGHDKALARTFKDWQTEVAIFDCAYLMLDEDGDAKSVFAMGSKLRWLTKICHDNGVLPMLLHHSTKAPFYTPMELHHLAYSGFDAWAAQWWLINRREAFDPESGNHRLWLTVGSRLDHAGRYAVDVQEGRRSDPGGRRWEVTVSKPSDMEEAKRNAAQAAQEAGNQEQLDRDRKLIVERCLKMGSGGTETDIRKRARINGQRFAFAFTTLVDDGTFEECELVKGNNRKFHGFKLRADSDE